LSEEIIEVEEKKEHFFKRAWVWIKADKERLAAIIFLTLFVVLIIILAALNLNMGQIMQNIVSWFEDKIGLWGIYIGVFVISIFGNFTVIFPIPYTLALVTVATRPSIGLLDIFIMGLFAGAGAGIGEASAWLLGRASKEILEESMEKQVNRAKKWVDKRLAPIIIFLFAATPLPDDAILLFIGLLGYALWKTIIWCFLGKIVLTTATGLAAKYLVGTNAGSWIFWAFGLTSEGSVGETPIWVSAITWIGAILVIGILMFVDWGDVWNRISRNSLKKKYKELLKLSKSSEISQEITFTESDESSKIFMPQRVINSKEASLWQCVTQNENNQYPDYHDLYTIPFVVGKTDNILFNSKWLNNFESNIANQKYAKVNKDRIEKLILPKEINENLESKEIVSKLAEKMVFIKCHIDIPNIKKKYRIGFLLEKTTEDKLKLCCIGEKEALIIKSFKQIPPVDIFSGYLQLLNKMIESPESVKKITYAYYEEKKEEMEVETK